MAIVAPPFLPNDVLYNIAEECLDVFTDCEIWFTLARVSQLFRKVVVRNLTEDNHLRKALSRKHATFLPTAYIVRKRNHSAIGDAANDTLIKCFRIAGCGASQDWTRGSDIKFYFAGLKPTDESKAIFRSEVLFNEHEYLEFFLQGLYGGVFYEHNVSPCLEQWSVYRLRPGRPLEISVEHGETEGTKWVNITYDWRKLWTQKCTALNADISCVERFLRGQW